MSWYSKVSWSEGLFLRQHHLQQSDRYFEKLLESRSRYSSPYPWGFSEIELDKDLTEQNKIGLRRATGIMPDGTPFDLPAISPLPEPIDVAEGAERKFIWAVMPAATANRREVDMAESSGGSRYTREVETIIDSTLGMHVEEDIEVAHPRITLEVRDKPKSGHHCLKVARILEVRDKTIVTDETFAPPILTIAAHPVVTGWLDRVIGWVETKLEALSRYASDTSSGGGLQNFDYFMLLMLNREINVLRHLRASRYVHPCDLYVEILRMAGELWTFSSNRLAAEYKAFDQDDLEGTFRPVLADIQRLLSLDVGRAVRLDLIERAENAYLAQVTDRNLFRNASFVIEVSASKPLSQIQQQFPALCKIGPNTKMNEIVQAHLPGVEMVHMPTPPRQVRAVSDHVYFQLDKTGALWPEFSSASAIGLHFAGEWPDLELDLWAIMEDRG